MDKGSRALTRMVFVLLAMTCVSGACATGARADRHAGGALVIPHLQAVSMKLRQVPCLTACRSSEETEPEGEPPDPRTAAAIRNLRKANAAKAGWRELRTRVRAGEVSLTDALFHRHAQTRTLLEVLGLAFVGLGVLPYRSVGRHALGLAREMTFTVDHATQVADLSYVQKHFLAVEFDRQANLIASGLGRASALPGSRPDVTSSASL